MTITGTYEISDEDLRDGGVYCDADHPEATWDSALAIDRHNLEDSVIDAWQVIDQDSERITLEYEDD